MLAIVWSHTVGEMRAVSEGGRPRSISRRSLTYRLGEALPVSQRLTSLIETLRWEATADWERCFARRIALSWREKRSISPSISSDSEMADTEATYKPIFER